MGIFRGILALYLLIINLITFIVWGVDKRRAIKQKRRVKEKTLLSLVGAGGRLGALAGISTFRHKTMKGAFLRWFWLWTGLWIIIVLTGLIMGS